MPIVLTLLINGIWWLMFCIAGLAVIAPESLPRINDWLGSRGFGWGLPHASQIVLAFIGVTFAKMIQGHAVQRRDILLGKTSAQSALPPLTPADQKRSHLVFAWVFVLFLAVFAINFWRAQQG
jgi:thiosulfate reductase cytochrome b subunit